MEIKPGSRWKSAVCDAQFVVVRAPASAGELQCGGAAVRELADPAAPSGAVDAAYAGGALVGKRYTDADSGIEVLCAKAGKGSLSFDRRAMQVKDAKPLPASD